jgi:hypothetical protein
MPEVLAEGGVAAAGMHGVAGGEVVEEGGVGGVVVAVEVEVEDSA